MKSSAFKLGYAAFEIGVEPLTGNPKIDPVDRMEWYCGFLTAGTGSDYTLVTSEWPVVYVLVNGNQVMKPVVTDADNHLGPLMDALYEAASLRYFVLAPHVPYYVDSSGHMRKRKPVTSVYGPFNTWDEAQAWIKYKGILKSEIKRYPQAVRHIRIDP